MFFHVSELKLAGASSRSQTQSLGSPSQNRETDDITTSLLTALLQSFSFFFLKKSSYFE